MKQKYLKFVLKQMYLVTFHHWYYHNMMKLVPVLAVSNSKIINEVARVTPNQITLDYYSHECDFKFTITLL